MSRREAQRLDFIGNFDVNKMSLIKGNFHVLRDILSRAPHVLATNLESSQSEHTLSIDLPNGMTEIYGENQFFAPFFRSLHGQLLGTSVQKDRILRLLPDSKMERSSLKYQEKLHFSTIRQRHLTPLI